MPSVPGKVALGVAVLIVVGLLAVAALAAMSVLGVPTVDGMDNEWGEVDDERIAIDTAVYVTNPNPFGLGYSVSSVEYILAMNGVPMAEGEAPAVRLSTGQTTVPVRSHLYLHQIPPWWVTHVENGERSELAVDATVHAEFGPLDEELVVSDTDVVETDIEGAIAQGLQGYEGEYHGPEIALGGVVTIQPAVEIVDTDASWGSVNESTTEMDLTFVVHNPNRFPLPVPTFAGEATFNDIVVGSWAVNDTGVREGSRSDVIAAGETQELEYRITLDNAQIAQWFATHVDRNEATDAALTAQFSFAIEGYTVTIPPDDRAFTCTFTLETDILVNREPGATMGECSLTPWQPSPPEQADGITGNLPEARWFGSMDDAT